MRLFLPILTLKKIHVNVNGRYFGLLLNSDMLAVCLGIWHGSHSLGISNLLLKDKRYLREIKGILTKQIESIFGTTCSVTVVFLGSEFIAE